MFFVCGECFAQVYIIRIAPEAFPVVRDDFDGAFFDFFENSFIG
jgi:hypothetical protein